jgi:low affinity Fe/Cu permease
MKHAFRRFAERTATVTGSAWTFLAAVALILVWGITGPLFHFSDAWQLTVNTGTTIVTFLMVFLIQNTQNRDAVAIQLKLDELIRGVEGARTSLVDLENLDDDEILRLRQEFERIHKQAANGSVKASIELRDDGALQNKKDRNTLD